MSFEDRIRDTLGAAAGSVGPRQSDVGDVMAKGRRYRSRAMAFTTTLGIVAAIGAIVTTGWVVGALRSAPDPAEPLPAPTSTTTVAPTTTVPVTTTTVIATVTTDAPAPVLATVEPLLLFTGSEVVYADGDIRQRLLVFSASVYPDLEQGVVFQPGSETSAAGHIYRLRPGSVEPELVVEASDEGAILSLLDVALVDGRATVFYSIEVWDPEMPIDGAGRRTLYFQDLTTGVRDAWGEIGNLDLSTSNFSAGGGLVAFNAWSGGIHEYDNGIEIWTMAGERAGEAFDPDGANRNTEGYCAGPCDPVLSADGSKFGYVVGERTVVVVDTETGQRIIEAEFPHVWLDEVGESAALLRVDGVSTLIDLESGLVTALADAVGPQAHSGQFASDGLSLDLPYPLRPAHLLPAPEPEPEPEIPSALPEGVSLLVADGEGVSMVNSAGIETIVSRDDVWAVSSDLEGGVVYATPQTIVWQPATGPAVEIASNPGGRIDLGTVASFDGERSVLYVIGQEIWQVNLSDLSTSLWAEVPAEASVWNLSVAGSTVGYVTGYTYRIETNFTDGFGNTVEEPFDPEPTEACHPFENWCIGDMLLNPENDTLVYSWVLAGMDDAASIRILDRRSGATTMVVVPNLTRLNDYRGNYATVLTGSSGLVLIDAEAGSAIPIELMGVSDVRHVAITG